MALTEHHRLGAVALAIFTAVALFYLPTSRYSLVNYDDHEYVVENGHLRDGLTVDGIRWAFGACGYASNWHPLSWTSMMLDVSAARLLGDAEEHLGWMKNAGLGIDRDNGEWTAYDGHVGRVMHVHNLLLHAANASLLFLLAMMLLRRGEDASSDGAGAEIVFCALLCLLWAMHPLRMEVACWASERKELLCAFFMLLSLIFWTKAGRGAWSRVASLLFFALALMSKPVAVTLPAVMLAVDLVFCGRVRWWFLLPSALMSAACCALTMVAQQTAMAETALGLRVSMALKAPLVYLVQTAWPSNLSFFYLLDDEVDWLGAACGAALLVFLAWVCVRWLRRRERWAGICAFGVAWCYVGLIPMLGLVKVGNQPHSDRYTYWVGCGMTVCLSLLLCPLLRRLCAAWRANAVKVLAVVAVAYAVAGMKRMPVWSDPCRLMADGYAKSLAFVDVAERYSWVLYRLGDQPAAESALRQSAVKWPCASSFANLAVFLSMKDNATRHDMDEARHFSTRAIEMDERCVKAYEALTETAVREDDLEEAVSVCEKAIGKGLAAPELEKWLPKLRAKLAERPPGWKKVKRVPWE